MIKYFKYEHYYIFAYDKHLVPCCYFHESSLYARTNSRHFAELWKLDSPKLVVGSSMYFQEFIFNAVEVAELEVLIVCGAEFLKEIKRVMNNEVL
jgi:hypothetical protein